MCLFQLLITDQGSAILERRFLFVLLYFNSPKVMNKRWLGSIYLIGFSLGLVLYVLSGSLMCM